jgi:hypothetical protein
MKGEKKEIKKYSKHENNGWNSIVQSKQQIKNIIMMILWEIDHKQQRFQSIDFQ